MVVESMESESELKDLKPEDIETTLRVLNDYVYWHGHGDVLLGDPVGEVMKSLAFILNRNRADQASE